MRLRTRLTAAAISAVLCLGTSACGLGGAAADPTTEPVEDISASPTIAVLDNAFQTVHAGVAAGTTVVWSWEEAGTQHNVVGEDFSSPVQDSGTFAHTFDEPGTYAYRCTIHGPMRGAVTVTGA